MPDKINDSLEFPVTPNYSPIVPIEIVGITENKQVVAVVDTGFTGFLQIPLAEGIATNLRLWGIRPSKLADGRVIRNLECFGSIRFAGKQLIGIISLSDTSNDCLLGMQFLEELQADFTISPSTNKTKFEFRKETKEEAKASVVKEAGIGKSDENEDSGKK